MRRLQVALVWLMCRSYVAFVLGVLISRRADALTSSRASLVFNVADAPIASRAHLVVVPISHRVRSVGVSISRRAEVSISSRASVPSRSYMPISSKDMSFPPGASKTRWVDTCCRGTSRSNLPAVQKGGVDEIKMPHHDCSLADASHTHSQYEPFHPHIHHITEASRGSCAGLCRLAIIGMCRPGTSASPWLLTPTLSCEF